MQISERRSIFNDIIQEIDIAWELINEYDSKPHKYGDVVLYQAESYMVNAIGQQPGITVTDLAKRENKTKSACSQILRKLMQKGFVVQERNEDNHREYLLYLTEAGEKTYQAHKDVNDFCTERSLKMLDNFTDDELKMYLEIQRKINESFREDVKTNCEKSI